jgi:hypothetical protein
VFIISMLVLSRLKDPEVGSKKHLWTQGSRDFLLQYTYLSVISLSRDRMR